MFHYYTYLAVTLFKKRTGDDATRLFHCYQLGNVMTAWFSYLHTHGNIYQNHACFDDLKWCFMLQIKINECLHVIVLQFQPR